jgi:hypothetical protein
MPWLLDLSVKGLAVLVDRRRLGPMAIMDGMEKMEMFVPARN